MLGLEKSRPEELVFAKELEKRTFGLLPFDPSAFHSETAKENCFGGSSGCSSHSTFTFLDVPEITKHRDTTLMKMQHGRIFIVISKILRQVLLD
jgi:hypothetical protein